MLGFYYAPTSLYIEHATAVLVLTTSPSGDKSVMFGDGIRQPFLCLNAKHYSIMQTKENNLQSTDDYRSLQGMKENLCDAFAAATQFYIESETQERYRLYMDIMPTLADFNHVLNLSIQKP